MTAAKQLIDMQFLRTLVPLGDLSPEQLQRLMGCYSVELVESGKELFRVGDNDPFTYYLLSGQILLSFRSGSEREVKAQTTQARYMLVPERPRTATATTLTTSTVLKVERDVLEEILQWDDRQGFEVGELETGKQNDWMSHYLQSKVFLKLRAQNIQALMMRLEEIPVRAGQVIIRQGDDDGYYYIIKKGHCQVTRRNAPNEEEKELAVLTVGTGFGEEAIITHSRRGATVTMLDNGALMRLSRSDFRRLLVDPLIEDITFQSARMLDNVVFLDVRSYDEYVRDGLHTAEHIALTQIRPNIDKFELEKIYVTYSDNVYSASAASFLLCQQGVNSVVLRGGLNGIPEDAPRGNRPDDDIPIVANVITFNQPQATPREEEEELPDEEYDLEEVMQDPRVQALFKEESAGVDAVDTAVPEPELDEEAYDADRVMQDPRVQALFNEAQDRIHAQSDLAAEADAAKRVAEEEVARLKQEAEQAKRELLKARKIAELAAKQSAQKARLQASKEAARLRELELGAKQAEMEEAVRQAEEEARRAQDAETARLQAEDEIQNLKRQMQIAVANAKQEAQQSADIIKQFITEEARKQKQAAAQQARLEAQRAQEAIEAHEKAQAEIERLKAEAEATRLELELQAQRAAEEARRVAAEQAERITAEHRQRELQAREAAEAELDQMRDELAKSRAEAEAARIHAELQIEQLKVSAEQESQRKQAEAEAAAQRALAQAKQEAQLHNEQMLEAKQAEIDFAIREAESSVRRALDAEKARDEAEQQIVHLRDEASKTQSELQSQLSDDIARSEIEHEVARARAIELANKQAEIEEITRRADEESKRALMAEKARGDADAEVTKLKEEIQRLRQQAGPQSSEDAASNSAWQQQREQDIARKEKEIATAAEHAQQEADRAHAAEAAFQQASDEIQRLHAEMEVATLQAKAQLEADAERAAAQKEEMERKALVLAQKQAEIAAAVERAELEKQRAEEAETARKDAEEALKRLKKSAAANEKVKQELARIQAESKQKDVAMQAADKRAAREAARAEKADRARMAAEEEIKRLKQMAMAERRKAEQAIKASMKNPNDKTQPKKKKSPANAQWISDQVMWETTLGMREDKDVSDILEPVDDFDDLESMKETLLTDIPLVPRQANEPDPVFDEPVIYSSSVERSAFQARELTPGVGPQANAREYVKRRRGLLKPVGIIVMALLVLGGGALYFTMSDNQQTAVKSKVKAWTSTKPETSTPSSKSTTKQVEKRKQTESIEERVMKKRRAAEEEFLRRQRRSAVEPLKPKQESVAAQSVKSQAKTQLKTQAKLAAKPVTGHALPAPAATETRSDTATASENSSVLPQQVVEKNVAGALAGNASQSDPANLLQSAEPASLVPTLVPVEPSVGEQAIAESTGNDPPQSGTETQTPQTSATDANATLQAPSSENADSKPADSTASEETLF